MRVIYSVTFLIYIKKGFTSVEPLYTLYTSLDITLRAPAKSFYTRSRIWRSHIFFTEVENNFAR